MSTPFSDSLAWFRRTFCPADPPGEVASDATPGSGVSKIDASTLTRMAESISEILGERGGAPICALLSATSLLDRMRFVSSWAVSPREGLRLALARGLSHPIDAIGARTAMEHLAQDPSSRVRTAVARAAQLRGSFDRVNGLATGVEITSPRARASAPHPSFSGGGSAEGRRHLQEALRDLDPPG